MLFVSIPVISAGFINVSGSGSNASTIDNLSFPEELTTLWGVDL